MSSWGSWVLDVTMLLWLGCRVRGSDCESLWLGLVQCRSVLACLRFWREGWGCHSRCCLRLGRFSDVIKYSFGSRLGRFSDVIKYSFGSWTGFGCSLPQQEQKICNKTHYLYLDRSICGCGLLALQFRGAAWILGSKFKWSIPNEWHHS